MVDNNYDYDCYNIDSTYRFIKKTMTPWTKILNIDTFSQIDQVDKIDQSVI